MNANHAVRLIPLLKEFTIFVEYWGPSGVRVGINIDPTKDDPVVNKKKHPTKAGSLESYNYDLYNLGTSKGEPNIQKITLRQVVK